MKITTTLLMLLALFLPNTHAHRYKYRGPLPDGPVARLGKGGVEEIQYSPDGARLALVSTIGIWLYDTTTYRGIALLDGHIDSRLGVSFSPDGKTLVSVGPGEKTVASWSPDDTIRLWDAVTVELKETLTGHTNWVESVAFSPDGKTLASGSRDGTVLLWKVAD